MESLENDNLEKENSNQTDATTTPSDNEKRSILHLPSLLSSLTSSGRILLQGPHKSGRSSLIMDLAHALASNTTCRSGCPTHCQCPVVTIIRPTLDEETSFPLYCQYLQSSDTPVHTEDTVRPKRAKLHHSSRQQYNSDALRRIRILRVASIKDALSYLLSVQGSLRGILFDDLDVLLKRETTDPIQAFMRMTQVGKTLDREYEERVLE